MTKDRDVRLGRGRTGRVPQIYLISNIRILIISTDGTSRQPSIQRRTDQYHQFDPARENYLHRAPRAAVFDYENSERNAYREISPRS